MLGWLAGGLALLVLLPQWGIKGVAVAVSVSYVTTLVVVLGFAIRLGAHPARLLMPTLKDITNLRAVLRSAARGRNG